MSSISASGIGQNLLQYLQQASVDTTSTAPTDPTASPTTSDADAADAGSQVAAPHHHHRHGGLKQIEAAVTSALQSAQASGTSEDPNKVVQTAIEQALGSANNAGASGASSTTATGSTDASGQSTFLQTLQAFGVSPQQFHDDFLSAVQNAQSGQVDPSTAFQSFPPGSLVDTAG